MRVLVDPTYTGDLLDHLRQRVDAVVAELGPGELEVGLLGSQVHRYARIELEERLQAWNAERPGVSAAIVE